MCGIAGQFNFQRREPVERETIVRMARSIAHRGPDDEGFFIAGPVGLGFRRLSIIDLAGGHQPMSDAQKTVWVIFNGEIYNYKELRAELLGKGYEFRTNSDTEVIIHGYKEWGTDVFNHLNGMFGLAIWDVPNERLVIARDAMGIKLIYYRLADGQLTFGSEIRAILAAGDSTVEKICIWTPDKDLAQCVRGDRVVQVDRRGNQMRDAAAVRTKFGVDPELIPDFLALVGDSADGYPGLPGIGERTAAQLLNRYGAIERFPPDVLRDEKRELALLFKTLATLRTDAPLFSSVDELRWRGPTPGFRAFAERMGEPRLVERCEKLLASPAVGLRKDAPVE